jgi:hypothetical protein
MRDTEERNSASRDGLNQYEKGDMDHERLRSEFILLQKKHNRYEQKEKQVQKLCSDWSFKKENENFYDFYKSVCELFDVPVKTAIRNSASKVCSDSMKYLQITFKR